MTTSTIEKISGVIMNGGYAGNAAAEIIKIVLDDVEQSRKELESFQPIPYDEEFYV
jgi:hypothetical protein